MEDYKEDYKSERLAYSIADVSKALGLSKPMIARLIKSGNIPALRVGKRWLIPNQSLNTWLTNAASAQKVFE